MVHNCLLIVLFACSHFGFACAFTCLPYFLQCLRALLVCFFGANCSHLHFLHICRFWPLQLARLSWVFCRCDLHFGFFKANNNYYFVFCFPLVLVTAILLFFFAISCRLVFATKKQRCTCY